MVDPVIREAEILKELEKLEKKEKELTTTIHVQNPGYHDPYSDMTYGSEDYWDTKGTQTEIDNVRAQIRKLKEELERIRSYGGTKVSNIQETSHQYAKGKDNKKQPKKDLKGKDLDEKARKTTFNDVKNAYRKTKGRGWDRTKNFLQGNNPNWKRISKYSKQELDYLLDTLRGETKHRQDSIRNIEQNKELSFNEQKKRISNGNWAQFVHFLRKYDRLKQSIELDSGKGTMHR